jgi:hypothetical protein
MKNCKEGIQRADKPLVFFSHQLKMMPVWFPWIFVGGVLFIVLSFLGAKYKDKEYKNIQFLQDFISGSILIAFTGVLVPDLFPVMDLPTTIPTFGMGSISDEMELQVGPPRLAGR